MRAGSAWFLAFGERGFPIPTVEDIDGVGFRFKIEIVETADIYQDQVRRRPRITERMDAAMTAKPMVRDLGIELIQHQIVTPRDQAKPIRRNATE